MKIISPKVHAILDYAMVLLLFCSPFIFNFGYTITVFTLILACVHLFMTLVTDFPGGLIAVVALRIHGLVELAVSIVLMIFSLVVDFDHAVVSQFYIVFSVAILITWILTDYDPHRRTFS